MDFGLLTLRLALGLLMAAHGSQKLFGWFGGYGLVGTGGFFESLGFRPGRLFAAAAAVCEVGSGLLIASGLFGPVGPAVMVSVMIVAAVSVHGRNGLFAAKNGVEMPLLYGIGGAALALTGPGSLSLDGVLGLTSRWTPALDGAVLVAGILGGLLNLALRRKPAPAPAAA
ncbi:MAG TPA: DoxX family protein [Thermoanaerobaculia bacterium]|nr:DoxX family protein [Thermoanaerobaculia bacterium]